MQIWVALIRAHQRHGRSPGACRVLMGNGMHRWGEEGRRSF
jgi:hypothetical protein